MNQSENLALAVARHKISAFVDQDDLMQQHRNAMHCRDCEDFLRAGILALKSLQGAECFMREGAYEGIFDFSPELREAVDGLYKIWLKRSAHAEEWIAHLDKYSYVPDNLEEFRNTCESVKEIVARREFKKRAFRELQVRGEEEVW